MLDNYGIRTDLALEATERFTEENVEVRGVEIHEDYNEEKDIIWLVDLWDLRQDPRKLNMRARRIERKDYH